jgi:hypothetical protein
MATKVPLPIVTTLVTTFHTHDLPVCSSTYHPKSCRRFKQEAGCQRMIPLGKTQPAKCHCVHTYLR